MKKGFTLIELMIVVAIIGILAMIAMPAYQDYVKRVGVAEALQLIMPVKLALLEYHQDYGRWPADMNALTGYLTIPANSGTNLGNDKVIPMEASLANGYTVVNGTIYIYFSEKLEAKATGSYYMEIPVRADLDDGSIAWYCGDAAARKFPQFVTTVYGINNVRARYMPANCR